MNKWMQAGALALGMAASTMTLAADKLRIATDGTWAPFSYIDGSGKLVGLDIDVANALCAKLDMECVISAHEWDGLIPSLKVKKFDAIVASMSITEDRQKQVDFTDYYYSGGLRFMGPKDKTLDVTKAGLKGKSIGALRSSLGSQYLEDNLGDVVSVKLYDNQEAVYLDLISGRLDGAISDELPTYDWLKSDQGLAFEYKGESFAKNDKIGIAVRKSDPLKERLNKALQDIREDGTYEKINAKYFPFPIY